MLVRITKVETDVHSAYGRRTLEVASGDVRRGLHVRVWLDGKLGGSHVAGLLLNAKDAAELRDALIAHTGWAPPEEPQALDSNGIPIPRGTHAGI